MKALFALVAVLLLLMVVAAVIVSDPGPLPQAPPATAPPADRPIPPVPPQVPAADPIADVTCGGIVLGVDGKPAGGVCVWRTTEKPHIRIWTHTGESGAWNLTFPRRGEETVHEVSAKDEETGDEAGPARVRILPGCPPPFTLLRLRKSCRVAGRVVDPAGAPVPGAQIRVVTDRLPGGVKYPQASDTEDAVRNARTDRDGRFEVLVRHGPGGRVAALSADGVSGPIRKFTPHAVGATDIGDLPLRGPATPASPSTSTSTADTPR